MNMKETLFGPRSKQDASIPYTYIARVQVVAGSEMHDDYFAETICGLIEHLDANNIEPDEVSIFGLFRDHEIELDIQRCINNEGKWLGRPDICHSLEQHYKETLETQYKGHAEVGECAYEDRDRKGSGPY
jgi:hypothetical protein